MNTPTYEPGQRPRSTPNREQRRQRVGGDHDAEPEQTPQPTCGVKELTASSRGAWLIRSRGTSHFLDLDRHVYERRPDPTSSRFPFDFTPLTYTVIEQFPAVGSAMLVWFDEPNQPVLLEHFRRSSTIRCITPAMDEAQAPSAEPDQDCAGNSRRAPGAPHRPNGPAEDREDSIRRVGDSGRWRVTTLNSDYLLDLDARTATREPIQPGPLRGDLQPVPLLEVVSAELGRPLILRLRLRPDAGETLRMATTVLRIRKL